MPQNDTEASLDGQLELRKRSRRRLVGATALALLAIVVLPMVMDGEPRQPVQDVQVRIPSQDAVGFAARILPAKPVVTPLPPIDAEPKLETKVPEPPKTDGMTKTQEPVTLKGANNPPVAAVKPIEKAPEKPAEKPAGNKSDEAHAVAALSGISVGDQWIVQLGAYKEVANVKQLSAKLKQIGLPSYTEHFDSPQGQRTRVRAGPFKTKDAAEKARARIRTIGVDGQVAQK
jgi:DedD protein